VAGRGEALLLVVKLNGPTMMARIGLLRALNRNVQREFYTSRKDRHWGRRKLKRSSVQVLHPRSEVADTMKLSIEAELVYHFADDTQVIANLKASRTSDQIILSESLEIQPPANFLSGTTPYGDRSIRASLSGDVTIRYTALVENNLRQLLPQSGLQHVWSELPSEVLPFLLPSRFCPSDKFMRFAQREFAGAGDGVARVMAILEWTHRNVDYVPGVSDAQTTTEGTFVDRAGVCRDFTHLGITLARALGIPARAVSAYALQLERPDFHAIFEVYIANGWCSSILHGLLRSKASSG
jgi:transglutaminase-like putative cysteine protease